MGIILRTSNLKEGLIPRKDLVTISAVTADTMADKRTTGEKFLWTSSRANITPAIGALKAAAKPADAPLVIRYLCS